MAAEREKGRLLGEAIGKRDERGGAKLLVRFFRNVRSRKTDIQMTKGQFRWIRMIRSFEKIAGENRERISQIRRFFSRMCQRRGR